MITDLEDSAEPSLQFDGITNLTETSSKITETVGILYYVPSTHPVPLGRTFLTELADDSVRCLHYPRTFQEFEETVHSAIDFIAREPGANSAVVICPPAFIDRRDDVVGSSFLEFARLGIEDSNVAQREAYGATVDASLDRHDLSLAEYLTRLVVAGAVGKTVDTGALQRTQEDVYEDVYIQYDELSDAPEPLAEFFLRVLNLQEKTVFDRLEDNQQRNVFTVQCVDHYGEDIPTGTGKRDVLLHLRQLGEEVIVTFRRLALETVISRESSRNIEDLAPTTVDRDFIDTLQAAVNEIGGDDIELRYADPSDAGELLASHFGLVFAGADDDEISRRFAAAQDTFGDEAEQLASGELGERPTRDALDRFGRFLQHVTELVMISGGEAVNQELSGEEWIDIAVPYWRAAMELEAEEVVAYPHLTVMNEARGRLLDHLELEEEAAEIQAMEVSLENLPEFLRRWSEFVLESTPTAPSESDLLTTLVRKYDAFTDLVVSSYPEIVSSNEHPHIADLLEPGSESDVRIFLVIDSFGLIDFEVIQQLDALGRDPADVDVLYSNLPSYTPSAMATLLSGLPASETGIYGWAPRRGDNVYDLHQDYGSDAFDFIDRTTPHSFELIQSTHLSERGITRVAEQIADIRQTTARDLTGSQASLRDVREELTGELENALRQRIEVYTDPSRPPEAREAMKSDFVLYVSDFDSFLHTALDFSEFSNYYQALGGFIDQIYEDIESAIENAYEDAEPEFESESISLVVASDHGKITTYEREQIIDSVRSDYRFNTSMLTEALDVDEVFELNCERLEGKTRSNTTRVPLGLAGSGRSIPFDEARRYISDDETLSDETIAEAVRVKPYLNSGSKYMYGWTSSVENDTMTRLEQQPGIDVDLPSGEAIFDSPTIGTLSRYAVKGPRATDHGHHGGTSLGELCGVRLEFELQS
ncbi:MULTISPECIES: alkaline phosphatase family protein [Haloarcula]|uniref:alkaline phosphatase family protein n=1 Tax=Haloarcula TaxID=2237 RepID=UPI0023EC8D2F|nr:alkaline phosphatase family protein [Halomicroarcula sp. XH51]